VPLASLAFLAFVDDTVACSAALSEDFSIVDSSAATTYLKLGVTRS